MMLYSVCPYQYAAALASGINLFALNACGTFQSQLNALGGAAFSAGIAGGHAGTGDGIIGWFQRDEPDGDNVAASALPGPPPGVPGLSFLTLTNHFYTGAAALPWGRAIYPPLIAKADVVGFDLYPLQEWCRPERMADVFYAQRELVNLAAGKPTFQWIEANDWKCHGPNSVTPGDRPRRVVARDRRRCTRPRLLARLVGPRDEQGDLRSRLATSPGSAP